MSWAKATFRYAAAPHSNSHAKSASDIFPSLPTFQIHRQKGSGPSIATLNAGVRADHEHGVEGNRGDAADSTIADASTAMMAAAAIPETKDQSVGEAAIAAAMASGGMTAAAAPSASAALTASNG